MMTKGKKGLAVLAGLVLLTSVALGGCGSKSAQQQKPADNQSAANKPIELKVHHHVPPTSIEGKSIEAWAKRIEEKTNGKVKFTIFPGASLGEAKNAIDMAKRGIADVSFGFYGFFPNTFPMTEVMTLPMQGLKTATQANLVLWDLYSNTDYLKNEWKDVKVLGFFCHGPAIIGTKNKSIQSTADVKGLKLRVVGGPPTDILKKLGAVPMNVPISEVYTSLEKGVINGYVFEWLGIKAWKLNEQSKYILDANLYVGPWFAIMNQNVWDKLPGDVKEVIDKESGLALAQANGKIWDEAKQSCIDESKKAGVSVLTLPDKTVAEWQAMGKDVAAEWIKTNSEKGFKAQEVYNKTQELIKKYEGK